MEYILQSARYVAADCISRVVKEGDIAVDATMGNGHDTCTLARLVGKNGHVFAFDIQPSAVESTKKLLASEGEAESEDFLSRCTLLNTGHEHMLDFIHSRVKTVVFNLGWLPGGNKSITTHWDTTKQAVDSALALLEDGGVCTICCYPGHAAGDKELHCLFSHLAELRPQEYTVLHHKFINAGAFAPECFIVQKNAGK